MKVFFNASGRSLKKYSKECKAIRDLLKNMGYSHTFLSGWSEAEPVYSYDEEALQILYKEALRGISEADIVVLELSTHSFTQGFLVKKALDSGKPVIALHNSEEKVAFVLGITDENLQVYSYTLKTLPDVLKESLAFAEDKTDIRFNCMLSSRLTNYLAWMARHKKITRAAFVRSLIQEHLDKNQEFSE